MASLSCLSIFEPGAFGSNSGNVVVPTTEVPFHIQIFSVGTASGTGSALAVGSSELAHFGTAAGVGSATAVGATALAIVGAQVTKSADQTAATYSPAVTVVWNSEVFDTDGFHDNVTDNTRLTIPSALNNHYMLAIVSYSEAALGDAQLTYASLDYSGSATGAGAYLRNNGTGADSGGTEGWLTMSHQPIQVATGAYFTTLLFSETASITVHANRSTFSLIDLGTSITGALVKKASDQTTANFSAGPVVLAWDTEVYDSNSFHDNVTANSRLTVPSAVNGSYGVFKFNLRLGLTANNSTVWVEILKNGAVFAGMAMNATHTTAAGTNAAFLEAASHPTLLATGDYYEAAVYCSDSSVTVLSATSSFGIYVLPTFQGVIAKKASDQTAANYSTASAVAFDTDVVDADAVHNTSSGNSKFIIPAGYNGRYGIFTGSVQANSVTTNSTCSLCLTKGGSKSFVGFAGQSQHQGNLAFGFISFTSPPVLLTTAEEYEMQFYCSDTSVDIESDVTLFSLRLI